MTKQTIMMMISEAERFLKYVTQHGAIRELRVQFKDTYFRSGRYDDVVKMARHAVRLHVEKEAPAVFYSLNVLKPESKHIGAKEPNIENGSARRDHSAKNKDI